MAIQADQRYYLKLKALYYFYEKGRTQTEIAKLLGVSRVTLAKLLDEARAEGMVRIEIVDTKGSLRLLKLADEFKSVFGLSDARLVDCDYMDSDDVGRAIALEAAQYFGFIVRSGMKIGFTWGRTLNKMVEFLPLETPGVEGIEVYTLVGGAQSASAFQPALLALEAAQKYRGTAFVMNAPFMCGSRKVRDAIKKEPSIAWILERSRELDLTMVGIGEEPMEGADHLSDYPFDKNIIHELVEAKAVGDICGNFFDIRGVLCDTSIRDLIVSIDPRELKTHKNVVAVGGGRKKTRSLLGALNGGYLDTLITDAETAQEVLRLRNRQI